MGMAKEDWKIYEEGKKMLEKQKQNKEESMKGKGIRIIIDRLCSERSLVKNALLELEELERIATEYESNKHYIELGKAVEYAVQNEIRFIRPLKSCEKLIFIDSYDKAKLIKEIIEQGGPFNE